MKTLWIALLLALTICAGAQKVRIAAAANMRYAMEELLMAYKKKNAAHDIEVIYGSSGNFYAQIVNGAPFDIFFSADVFYPNKLHETGQTWGEVKVYAIGQLVLWSSAIELNSGVEVLNQYPKARIAMANPDLAPYGQKTVETLRYYGVYDKIKPQLIVGENISQTAQFCLTGNAQFGFIALSLAISPTMKNAGSYYLVDNAAHSPLEQAYVIFKRAKDNARAHAFASYISSPEAIAIFEKYGFLLPD